ncbi:condensation domain-containing protein, partial [Streptomyces sp. NPDC056540]|uniref:condensation domain-containing protein n=1 Tax=Streptomyces sp. NPDC056540 TaxID=3345859 RepID=UPI0036CC47AF
MQGDLQEVLPLSPLQEGMLFHALYEQQGLDVYTAQFSLELQGGVSVAGLRQACADLLQRHATLRAGFRVLKSGAAVQFVLRGVPLAWREEDLRLLSGDEQRAQVARVVEEEQTRRFDLARPPLIRFALLRLAEDRWRLVVSNHHILLDGWSLPLLLQDLFTLYTAHTAHTAHTAGSAGVLPRVTPYRDYLAWLKQQDAGLAR